MWRFNPFPIHLCLATLWLCTGTLWGQVFQNQASNWGISQYDWDGHYGAAVSTADWNNDGWPDLTFGGTQGALRTFVNQGGNGFEALPLPWFMGSETKAILWLDVDNYGDDDLFVQEEHGKCGLIRNDGDTAFVDVTSTSHLPQDFTESAGVSFGDMDNDGDLDLHLCRYLEWPINEGPSDHNVLMRNDGDFVFTNVSEASGIDVHLRLSFQSLWWDHNHDGWQDIFVINDKNGANAMFENQGDGTFVDVAPELNMDLVMDCMSASLGDFNQDTRQDLFHTNTHFGGDGLGSKLLVRMQDSTFLEASQAHGVNFDRFCWGALWMDVDNDTDLDLFVTEHDFLNPYGINYLYENQGPATYYAFEPFGTEVYDIDYLNSHVVASADFDQNGWVDFVMHNVGNHAARVWMNQGFDNGFSSVGIALQGTLSNRPAIGSRMELHTSELVQSRIVHAGENYLSQENEVELFGLGDGTIEHVRVHWPSGLVEDFLPDVHGIVPMSNHILVEGHSLCPQAEVTHTLCADSSALAMDVPEAEPFTVEWTNASGDPINVSEDWVWSQSQGDLFMTAFWNDAPTCTVQHIVELEGIPGDFDVNGMVGTSDVLPLLSELGCVSGCNTDLNLDGAVGVTDLLLLLTSVGQSCL